ncbi:hypothetical protein D3P96_01350 [Weissella viridescens]|uniref:Uncharacterized protein n=1 Tax=Weissella viridescens TaxID=1629 RepID=A0A3P2RIU1_WEIVI|nr:hypothetical protein [Weissella viridescens]RRG18660.1 hypothetical protein D3P96_01350 [Weissella viridescens]
MERYQFRATDDEKLFESSSRIQEIINNLDNQENNFNFLDAIEANNILELLENIDSNNQKYGQIVKKIKTKITGLLRSITNNDIQNAMIYFFKNESEIGQKFAQNYENKQIDRYTSTEFSTAFLQLFSQYHLERKFSGSDFEKMVIENEMKLYSFLKVERFIKIYREELRRLFLRDFKNVELAFANEVNGKEIYLLRLIVAREDLSEMIDEYLLSEKPNINYLSIIEDGINDSNLRINANQRRKATTRKSELEEEFIENGNGTVITHELEIGISLKSTPQKENENLWLIDTSYVADHHTKKDLFNFILGINKLYTANWIIALCSFPKKEIGILENLVGNREINNYQDGMEFIVKNRQMNLIFKLLDEFFSSKKFSNFEEIITYFFEEYAEENFGIDWLHLFLGNESIPVNARTYALSNAEEKIRREWNHYVENKEVDQELFGYTQTPEYPKLKSLLSDKYIYCEEKGTKIVNLLFGSAWLGMVNIDDGNLINEDNFERLINQNNNIKLEMFYPQVRDEIEFLLENEVISEDSEGYLYFSGKQLRKMLIFKLLYEQEVINYHAGIQRMEMHTWENQFKPLIKELMTEDIVFSESTLLSKPESDYLKYMMTDYFKNSRGLRNIYSHGGDIGESIEDYYTYVIVIMILIIKINEELIAASN